MLKAKKREFPEENFEKEEVKRVKINAEDYVKRMISEVNYKPLNDMVLYLVTYKVREEVEKAGMDAPEYLRNTLFGGDQEEDITKQKAWLIAKGPNCKNLEDVAVGSRITVRGNPYKVNVRINEGLDIEEEHIFITVRDYDVIGVYA